MEIQSSISAGNNWTKNIKRRTILDGKKRKQFRRKINNTAATM
jgi:hypothetical protein